MIFLPGLSESESKLIAIAGDRFSTCCWTLFNSLGLGGDAKGFRTAGWFLGGAGVSLESEEDPWSEDEVLDSLEYKFSSLLSDSMMKLVSSSVNSTLSWMEILVASIFIDAILEKFENC